MNWLRLLAENISWPIARGAFAASVLKIEEESISWALPMMQMLRYSNQISWVVE